MEVTLNKANNCLNKLKGEIKKVQTSKFQNGYVSLNLQVNRDTDVLITEIDKKYSDALETRDVYFDLVNDINDLKNAIFECNVKIGMSGLLSEIEKTKLVLNMSKTIQNSFNEEACLEKDLVTKEYIEKEKLHLMNKDEVYYSRAINVFVSISDKEKVNKEVKELQKKLNSLEDKKVALNATTKIEINLSNSAIDLLGL